MTLKIIGGEYRGRSLKSVRGYMTRPLLGQVREALFNILGDRVEGAEVWDLFAGTGASGLEALSRGAERVTFVEKSPKALRVLQENLAALGPGASERARIVRADAWQPPPLGAAPAGAETPAAAEESAVAEVAPALAFFDPPYAQVAEDPARAAWRAGRLVGRLAPGGLLLFHFEGGFLDEDDFDAPTEVRNWGRCAVALLRRPAGG